MAEAAGPRQITDIANPGKTAPNPSSRPIIISDKPLVQDPMVGGERVAVASAPTPAANAPQAQSAAPVAAQPAVSEPAERAEGPSPAHMTRLVDDKTYFNPISQPPQRNTSVWLLVFGAVALIGGGIAYLVLTIT